MVPTGDMNGHRASGSGDHIKHRSIRGLHALISEQLRAAAKARLSTEEIRLWGEVIDVREGEHCWFLDLMDAKVDGLMLSATLPLSVEPPPPDHTVGIDGHLRLRATGPRLALELHGMRLTVKGVSSRAQAREALLDEIRRTTQPFPLNAYAGGSIVLVASKSSRALGDFKRNLGVEFELAPIVVEDVRLSDAGQLAQCIRAAAERADTRLIVLIRGGGSPGDLCTFSHPGVVRAVAEAAARRPVLTGIGHADDRTLADEVASCSASTPSHAARIVRGMLRRAASARAPMVQPVPPRRSRRLAIMLLIGALVAGAATYFAIRSWPRPEEPSRPAAGGEPAHAGPSGAPTRSKPGQRGR